MLQPENTLLSRSKRFAINVFHFAGTLPPVAGRHTLADQIIRSSFSQAANYRAARRAKSKNDFAYKLKIVLEEADETLFWLELIRDLELQVDRKILNTLICEANELVAIYSASVITFQNKLKKEGDYHD